MALLLAMYQKMKLVREKNQLQYDQIKYSNKLSRVEKNIERQKKRFTSLFAQLESQAKQMQSQATVYFQQFNGIGTNNYSNLNPAGFTGMNGFVANIIGNMLTQGGYKYKDSSGKEQTLGSLSPDRIQEMMNEYMSNGGQFRRKLDTNNNATNEFENFKPEEVAAFMSAMQTGNMQQQQAQQWANSMNTQYAQNVSIWLEARKAELEAEEEAVMEPLNYEQTMMELEKESAELRLKRIESELQNVDQLVSQEAQNSAPKFGLG